MKDETMLRRIARESIAKGLLPIRSPQQTWGGPGTGAKCALCGARVDKDELEFEAEFGSERFHLHLACFSAWDAERKALSGIGAAPSEIRSDPLGSSAARAASPSTDKLHVLPDRHGDGNIVDHGGGRAYKPGAA